MTFTYVLSTDTGKLRLKLGDRKAGAGPRPDNENFTDEELGAFLTEGTTVDGALILACEALANKWGSIPDTTYGPWQESSSQVAARWQDRAKELRTKAAQAAGFELGSLNLDYIEPEAT